MPQPFSVKQGLLGLSQGLIVLTKALEQSPMREGRAKNVGEPFNHRAQLPWRVAFALKAQDQAVVGSAVIVGAQLEGPACRLGARNLGVRQHQPCPIG